MRGKEATEKNGVRETEREEGKGKKDKEKDREREIGEEKEIKQTDRQGK